jgi:hypothetical protein
VGTWGVSALGRIGVCDVSLEGIDSITPNNQFALFALFYGTSSCPRKQSSSSSSSFSIADRKGDRVGMTAFQLRDESTQF